MGTIPALPVAALLIAGCLNGCAGAGQQSAVTYPSYGFSCCSSAETQRVWHPGESLALNWIVHRTGETAEPTPGHLTLTAVLTGPYADVNALKAGRGAARRLTAPAIAADDRRPGSPISTIPLPPDLPPGYYNLAFSVEFGSGSSGGAGVIQVAPAGG